MGSGPGTVSAEEMVTDNNDLRMHPNGPHPHQPAATCVACHTCSERRALYGVGEVPLAGAH